MRNQCDGCQCGLPISEHGFHHTEQGPFMCTRARYRLELQPKERETWHQPKKTVPAPFTCGGRG